MNKSILIKIKGLLYFAIIRKKCRKKAGRRQEEVLEEVPEKVNVEWLGFSP